MPRIELNQLDSQTASKSLTRAYKSLSDALNAISHLSFGDETETKINEFITEVNSAFGTKKLKVTLVKKRYSLVELLDKKEGLVPKNRYRNQWMILGMTVFGLPFGFIWALSLDNFAFFSIGLPMGMPIGMAVGAIKDKKAKEEGRQLDFEA
ncbi:MAG: hypothetical protein AAGC47_10655 [Bacteroidota bacterium]